MSSPRVGGSIYLHAGTMYSELRMEVDVLYSHCSPGQNCRNVNFHDVWRNVGCVGRGARARVYICSTTVERLSFYAWSGKFQVKAVNFRVFVVWWSEERMASRRFLLLCPGRIARVKPWNDKIVFDGVRA